MDPCFFWTTPVRSPSTQNQSYDGTRDAAQRVEQTEGAALAILAHSALRRRLIIPLGIREPTCRTALIDMYRQHLHEFLDARFTLGDRESHLTRRVPSRKYMQRSIYHHGRWYILLVQCADHRLDAGLRGPGDVIISLIRA